MPPKKQVVSASSIKNKEVDSKLPAESNEDEEMLDINEQNFLNNNNTLRKIRTNGAINAGILSGLFNLSGLGGIVCYVAMFFLISFCLLLKTKYNTSKYFLRQSDVVYGGMSNDVLTFIVIWVITHNLVNIL